MVQKSANDKGYKVDIMVLLQLDDERRDLQKQVEVLREQRNAISAKMKGGRPDQELIDQGKQLKIELAECEGYLKSTEEKVVAILKNVPNYAVSRGWVDFERGAKVAGAKFYYLKGDLALLENAES